ncbi:MAG TPA: anti-sigma factor, partial [Burkholderiales bacterium]
MRDDKALHAYLDGELDAAASLELERAMAENPALRASCERLRELSAAVREKADYHAAPARFKKASAAKRPWLMLAPAFAFVLLIGVGIGTFIAQPRDDDALGADVVASHVRATLAGRLVDVPSSDQHTVKPWLSARLPFSPPVVDLSQDGYALVGARLDYVAGQSVAALVYKRREHVIDVFVSPGAREAAPSAYTRDGFNVARFARGGMRYWIVS